MSFHQKLLKKAVLLSKMTGPAIIQPVTSNFWKAPGVFKRNVVAINDSAILCKENQECSNRRGKS